MGTIFVSSFIVFFVWINLKDRDVKDYDTLPEIYHISDGEKSPRISCAWFSMQWRSTFSAPNSLV